MLLPEAGARKAFCQGAGKPLEAAQRGLQASHLAFDVKLSTPKTHALVDGKHVSGIFM